MTERASSPPSRRQRLASRLRAEGGFAMPMVLLGTVAALGLASAMVMSSLSATSGVERDTDTKSAFAVAEAGVSNALFRYNRFDTFADPTKPCLGEGAGGQVILVATEANGWCPAVSANAAGGQFDYSVRPSTTTDPIMEIVSTGFYNGLSRRVEVAAEYTTQPGNGGVTPFDDVQLIGKDSITINNGSTITADVGTLGTLTVTNGGKLHCEEAQASSTNFAKGPPCTVVSPDFDVPAVDNTVAKTTNNNSLLAAPGCRSWNATSKLLTISCKYTLGSAGTTQDYYLCKLTLNNGGELTIAPGANVNIWFAPPEECGGNTVPYVGNNGSKIRATGNPPSTLAFLVSDSPTTTTMNLTAGGNGVWPDCTDNFIIYAPTTNVTMSTAAHICAGIAAKSLTTGPGSTITKTSGSTVWELPGSTGGPVPHYSTTSFLECPPATTGASTPDAGC